MRILLVHNTERSDFISLYGTQFAYKLSTSRKAAIGLLSAVDTLFVLAAFGMSMGGQSYNAVLGLLVFILPLTLAILFLARKRKPKITPSN